MTCAAPSYLERHGTPTHPSQLEEGHVLVKYFYASGRHLPVVLSSGDEQYTVRGRQFVAVNDGNALLAAGLAGLGVMHLPAFIAQPQIEAGRLRPVLQEWQVEALPVSIVYAPNRQLSTRVRVFVDWLIDLFQNHKDLRRE